MGFNSEFKGLRAIYMKTAVLFRTHLGSQFNPRKYVTSPTDVFKFRLDRCGNKDLVEENCTFPPASRLVAEEFSRRCRRATQHSLLTCAVNDVGLGQKIWAPYIKSEVLLRPYLGPPSRRMFLKIRTWYTKHIS